MNQSYVRRLLYTIADKINKRRQDMQQFITLFENNWYDSKEALLDMSEQDFQKIQIPQRLVTLIRQEIGYRQPQSNYQNKMDKMDIESPVEQYLVNLNRQFSQNIFAQKIEILNKIFTNIRENLIDEKYRVLKKSNNKIAQLVQNKQVLKILRYGGFQEKNPGFVMVKVNIGTIDECIDSINKFIPKAKFNPYESSISSIGDTNMSTYEGDSSVVFNQKLAELEKERESMMSRPIKNREINVFQIEPANLSKFNQQFNQQKQFNNDDERMYMQNMKNILKRQGEDPKFMNRRKQQYLDLVKRPCFTQTLIRVKMPDNWIFQCKFAPLQTMQTFVDVFTECLQNKNLNFYLYMTPPVQKLTGMTLRKTFYQLGCVPRAIFYFKTEQQINGNIFRIQKSNRFGYGY